MPYTLHPKPYTLYPTLYTPHLNPYTLHPTTFNLHPTQACPSTSPLPPPPQTKLESPHTLHLPKLTLPPHPPSAELQTTTSTTTLEAATSTPTPGVPTPEVATSIHPPPSLPFHLTFLPPEPPRKFLLSFLPTPHPSLSFHITTPTQAYPHTSPPLLHPPTQAYISAHTPHQTLPFHLNFPPPSPPPTFIIPPYNDDDNPASGTRLALFSAPTFRTHWFGLRAIFLRLGCFRVPKSALYFPAPRIVCVISPLVAGFGFAYGFFSHSGLRFVQRKLLYRQPCLQSQLHSHLDFRLVSCP